MALTPEDLESLASFMDAKLGAFKESLDNDTEKRAVQNRDATVGIPDADPEAGPEFYIHLADGSVVTSKDSASTHLAGAGGEPVAVIGRYQKGE